MSEIVRLLRGIMKTSGWTQEQVAEKLDVSFVSMNAWLNERAKPRKIMRDKIRKLYLAQDITKDIDPTYITLGNIPNNLKIDDIILLEKDGMSNDYIILATRLNVDDHMRVLDGDIVSGTKLSRDIYERFSRVARGKIQFIFRGEAIARVIEWDYKKS